MVASNFDSNPVGNLSMTGSLPKGGVTMPQYWNSLDLVSHYKSVHYTVSLVAVTGLVRKVNKTFEI